MTLARRAPGRVNLIGEHTDYNDGYVLPVAIDRFTTVEAAPRRDRRLMLRSTAYAEPADIDLDAQAAGPTGSWTDYVRGVAAVLERTGCRLTGAELSIDSTVPIGAGLGSSAALEVAAACALLDVSGLALEPTAIARVCQQAEREFAGTQCGVMDQFVACHGRAGCALLLDTRTLAMDWVPLPEGIEVVVCNTMTTHALARDGYNERRAECDEGTRVLASSLPAIRALRDVSLEVLDASRDAMSDRVYRRCRHVVSENGRVLAASAALRAGDLSTMGRLMCESHRSLRDDFDVSTRELDAMVEIALDADGVFGARLTGGGFGGCTVSLVRADAVPAFVAHVAAAYAARTGTVPEIYRCVASDGIAAAPRS